MTVWLRQMGTKKKLFSEILKHFISDLQGWLSQQKSINVIHCINGLKDRSHTIISVDAEKVCDKIQQLFMMKAPKTLEIQGTYLSVMRE